jgi:hypothetical protein
LYHWIQVFFFSFEKHQTSFLKNSYNCETLLST